MTKWSRKKYASKNTSFGRKRIFRESRECRWYDARISRTDTFFLRNKDSSGWTSGCIWKYTNTRKIYRRRGYSSRNFGWIWEIYRHDRAISDTWWIHIWKWDRAGFSMNRDIPSSRKNTSWRVWVRKDQSSARESTSFKTWFPLSRWTNQFYRSRMSSLARELSQLYMEMMISHRLTW